MRRAMMLATLPLLMALAPPPAPAPPPQARAPEAEAAFAAGRYDEALRLATAALAACAPTPAQPDRCMTLALFAASTASAAARYDEAADFAKRALAVAETLPGGGAEERALALLALGGAQVGKGDLAAGRDSARKALTIAQGKLGDAHVITAAARFSLAQTLDKLDAHAEAETLYRAAIAGTERAMGPRFATLPSMTGALASNLADQARLAEATKTYERAVTLAREVHGRDHPAVALLLGGQAQVAAARGRFAEARAELTEALRINRLAYRPDHPLVARSIADLGGLALEEGKPAEAEARYRESLALAEQAQGPDHPALASDLGNLAGALRQQDRGAEAEALIRRAIAIDSKTFGANSTRAAGQTGVLAALLEDEGRAREAEPLRRAALTSLRAALGEAHPDTAGALVNLAANLAQQKRVAEAEPLLRQAVAIQRKALGEGDVRVADGWTQLGILLARNGGAGEAEPLFRRALALRRAKLGERHPETVTALHNLAAVLEKLGRYPEAERTARDALARRRAILAPGHPLTGASEELLARIVGRRAEGRPEALGLLREAMAIARVRRAAGAAREAADAAAITEGAQGGTGSFAAFLQLAWVRAGEAPAEAAGLRDEAFVAAQEIDVSAAGLAMTQSAARVAAGSGPLAVLARRQQDLARGLSLLDRRFVEALAGGKGELATELRKRIEADTRALGEVDRQLAGQFPDYAALIAPGPVSRATLATRLGKNEGLLFVRPVEGDLFVFAIGGGEPRWTRTAGGATQAGREVAKLRCQVDPVTCPPGAGSDDGFDLAAAYALYALAIAPVEPALAGTTKLYVTASGALADLPLDMLVTAAPVAGTPLGKQPWLGDRYAMVSLPQIAALRPRAPVKPGSVAFVGYGAPSLGRTAAAARGYQPPAPGARLADPRVLAQLASLPGTRTELFAMARALGAAQRTVTLGDQAREAAVRHDPRLAEARVIAFATHGLLPQELDGRNEPGLVLTPPAVPSADDDGLLTASEASGLSLKAEWVVLSACNTASGEGGSDGLSALARGFLYAGAQSLLASHWRVSDDVTAVLTVETLAIARRHPEIGKAVARQRAMQAIRVGKHEDGGAIPGWTSDWAHPASWAPFSLIGS